MDTREKNPAAVSLGRNGGMKTKEKHGTDHFKRAGKRSGAVRRAKAKNNPKRVFVRFTDDSSRELS